MCIKLDLSFRFHTIKDFSTFRPVGGGGSCPSDPTLISISHIYFAASYVFNNDEGRYHETGAWDKKMYGAFIGSRFVYLHMHSCWLYPLVIYQAFEESINQSLIRFQEALSSSNLSSI